MTNTLVIGGSSGIGLGIATAASERGHAVTIAGRNRERLERVAREGGFSSAVADATSERDMHALLTSATFDHIVLSTVTPCYMLIRELDLAKARAMIDSKLTAALHVAKHMQLRQSLTLITGVASERPQVRGAVTAAVNGALEALVRGLALELAPRRVNALSPGWVDTPIWDAIVGERKSEVLGARAATLLAGRIGTPDDLGHAALFLMENAYTTGQTLHVDGGHTLV